MTRLRVGDVLEAVAPQGFIYVHYVGKHPHFGDCIAVSPAVHPARMGVSAELFRESYTAFYPANAAVAQRLVSVVGNMPSPGVPSRVRRAIGRVGTTVKRWGIIKEGAKEVLKESLSQKELTFPRAEIWRHPALLERVSNGWRPESGKFANGRPAVGPANGRGGVSKELPYISIGTRHTISHYLYLPDKKTGVAVAAELRAKGFTTEESQGGDPGLEWLVLAVQSVEISEDTLPRARTMLESLAESHGGEYDGWELAVEEV
jgi:Regulator of ribonuclease activity B